MLDYSATDDGLGNNVNNYSRGDSLNVGDESHFDNDATFTVLTSVFDAVVFQEEKLENQEVE